MRLLTNKMYKGSYCVLLLLLMLPMSLLAQTRSVHGTVTDSKGQAAAAITVNVKGTNINTVTDENGSFTIAARELVGEEFRWYELKRTGKLVERVLLYNEEAKASNTIKATNLLRPIPQREIDLNRGTFPQNPGY